WSSCVAASHSGFSRSNSSNSSRAIGGCGGYQVAINRECARMPLFRDAAAKMDFNVIAHRVV
ncbi:MAG: hypothetical protein WBZ23_18645, partial [Pseudolabrys sp.]